MFRRTISRWSTNSNQKWHKTLNSFFEEKHSDISLNQKMITIWIISLSPPLPPSLSPLLPPPLPPLHPYNGSRTPANEAACSTTPKGRREDNGSTTPKNKGRHAAPHQRRRVKAAPPVRKKTRKAAQPRKRRESSTTHKVEEEREKSNTSPNEEGRSPVGWLEWCWCLPSWTSFWLLL